MEFYHLLNRGVDKREVFLDDQDRMRFVHNLFEFNDIAPATAHQDRKFSNVKMSDIGCRTFGDEGCNERKERELLVQLHAFCLMSNHYHLLVSPLVEDGVSKFMKKLNMGYAKYFNERYERSGALWQGKYKSVPIETDAHFLYIPFYIHFNPLDLTSHKKWREQNISDKQKAAEHLKKYRWSSHLDYLGIKNFPSLTQRDELAEIFKESGGYKKLVNSMLKDLSTEEIKSVTLE